MTDDIQDMILPVATQDGAMVVCEVRCNESESRVSLVTSDSRRPSLKATVERITALYPYAIRIRVLSPATLGLSTLCTFRLVEGMWLEQLPASMRPRRRLNASEQMEAMRGCFIGAVR